MIKKFISATAGLSMLFCTVSAPINTSSAVSLDITDVMVEEYQPHQAGNEKIPAPEDIPVNESIENLSGRIIKVMIDPGHYSHYNQSPVYAPYWESVMTWKLSNYLQKELQSLGVHADLTKSSLDEDPSLNDRGFSSKGYDFFISMHSNAGASSCDQPLAIIYQDLPWTTIDDTSKEMGEILTATVTDVMETRQKGITYQRKGTGDWDRNGIMDDEWYSVLFGSRYVGTPGILLEHSFHTNYRATLWLYNDDNLKRMAKEEAAVIFDYFSEKKALEYPEPPSTGDVNDDGIIDSSDSSLILTEYSVVSTGKESILSNEFKSIADINSDSVIDASDATVILEYYSYVLTGGEEKNISQFINNTEL